MNRIDNIKLYLYMGWRNRVIDEDIYNATEWSVDERNNIISAEAVYISDDGYKVFGDFKMPDGSIERFSAYTKKFWLMKED